MDIINRKLAQSFKRINLMTTFNQNSKILEDYRKLRTNCLSLISENNRQVLMITSPNREDGKSTTVVNLAISLAQQGKKVLLIDADLRNSLLHHSFKIDNSIGLSNVLSGEAMFNKTIFKTGIKGLDLLPSGPDSMNPSELLGFEAMGILIENVRDLYDIILFDTSPVLDFADAKIIANQCDGSIMVIRFGKTLVNEVYEAKKILGSAKAKLQGVILNGKK